MKALKSTEEIGGGTEEELDMKYNIPTTLEDYIAPKSHVGWSHFYLKRFKEHLNMF